MLVAIVARTLAALYARLLARQRFALSLASRLARVTLRLGAPSATPLRAPFLFSSRPPCYGWVWYNAECVFMGRLAAVIIWHVELCSLPYRLPRG